MVRYRGNIGWNTFKIISWLISLGFSLSNDPNVTDVLQGERPEIPDGIGVGQITHDIVFSLIYNFTFTSAFMQSM